MVCNVITADKANRLFWLGRYAERIYISLHLLRRYYDRVIDGDKSDIKEYYDCLGLEYYNNNNDPSGLHTSQLYDLRNVFSIASSLKAATDNAITLRQDITSESVSFLEMSSVKLEECIAVRERNITMLQPITDYMLAFFGSIDERVFDERIRKFLKIGRLIENLDLHIRFNYPFFRIEEVFLTLKEYAKREGAMLDLATLNQLDFLIREEQYITSEPGYKENLLQQLNTLATV